MTILFGKSAIALAESAGDQTLQMDAYRLQGNHYLRRDRYEEAGTWYERVRTIAQEVGDRKAEAQAIGNLGLVSRCLGRLEEARDLGEHALDVFQEIGDRHGEAIAMLGLRRKRYRTW